MTYSIKYKTTVFKVNGEKPVCCHVCGKTPKAKGLHGHHTKYEYSVNEVRKNHELAKENVIFLCFFCHRVCNAFRIVEENKEIVSKLSLLIAKGI